MKIGDRVEDVHYSHQEYVDGVWSKFGIITEICEGGRFVVNFGDGTTDHMSLGWLRNLSAPPNEWENLLELE